MSVRYPAMALTREDWLIFCGIANRRRLDVLVVLVQALDADVRDADLMFEAQRIRSYTFPVLLPGIDLAPYDGDVIACGGVLEEWRTLNADHFA